MTTALEHRRASIDTLRAWLTARKPELARVTFDDDTDIVAAGIVDSFALVELMMLIEEQTGERMLGERFEPESVRTLGRIYARYYV